MRFMDIWHNTHNICELVEIAAKKGNQKVSIYIRKYTHAFMKSQIKCKEMRKAYNLPTFGTMMLLPGFFYRKIQVEFYVYMSGITYQNSNERTRKYLTNDEHWIIQQMSRFVTMHVRVCVYLRIFRIIIIWWLWLYCIAITSIVGNLPTNGN